MLSELWFYVPHTLKVSAGPAADLGQGTAHSFTPFHPSEPPAASVLYPHLSSLLLIHARDCLQDYA